MNMLSGLRPLGSQLLRDACRLRGEQLAAASSERGLRAWRRSEACRLPRGIPTHLVRGTYRTYIYFRTTYRIVLVTSCSYSCRGTSEYRSKFRSKFSNSLPERREYCRPFIATGPSQLRSCSHDLCAGLRTVL